MRERHSLRYLHRIPTLECVQRLSLAARQWHRPASAPSNFLTWGCWSLTSCIVAHLSKRISAAKQNGPTIREDSGTQFPENRKLSAITRFANASTYAEMRGH